MTKLRPPSPTLVDDTLWIVWNRIGFAQYDFDFEEHFPCSHPYDLDNEITAIARMGSPPDYQIRYKEMAKWKIRLINSPEDYQRSSLLPHWYPKIKEFTPRSFWFNSIPTTEEITSKFEFPIFVKGERQTNKHSRAQSIIETDDQLEELIEHWSTERILWWQRLVCREYHPLRLVSEDFGGGLPKSYEFRTFWFRGNLVGAGRYWVAENYEAEQADLEEMKRIGKVVSARLCVPFLVIDFAQTAEGQWIVIECNDGQNSGYAGVNAREMWRAVIEYIKG